MLGDLGDSEVLRTFVVCSHVKKKNRTGTISVVVVDKSRGGFKEVKNFGVAKTEEEADRLYAKATE